MAASRSERAFRRRVHNLTPELFNKIYDFFLELEVDEVVHIDKTYKPPVQLQLCRSLRAKLFERYYSKSIFVVCDNKQHCHISRAMCGQLLLSAVFRNERGQCLAVKWLASIGKKAELVGAGRESDRVCETVCSGAVNGDEIPSMRARVLKNGRLNPWGYLEAA